MQKLKCEFCNKLFPTNNSFVCINCNKLNSLPLNIDYFSYLQIPIIFPLNKQELETKYIKLLTLYHPDRYVNTSSKEQMNAIIHSSYLNQAYINLKDEIKFLAYIYFFLVKKKLNLEAKTITNQAVFFFNLNEELSLLKTKREKINFKNKIENYYNETIKEITKALKNKDYKIIEDKLFGYLTYLDQLNKRIE